ncbi:MAG: hypothetical protein L0216_07490 [Planctomycetales bacterium]|nr:hypothetical protein [Planctomycetales bacterium]
MGTPRPLGNIGDGYLDHVADPPALFRSLAAPLARPGIVFWDTSVLPTLDRAFDRIPGAGEGVLVIGAVLLREITRLCQEPPVALRILPSVAGEADVLLGKAARRARETLRRRGSSRSLRGLADAAGEVVSRWHAIADAAPPASPLEKWLEVAVRALDRVCALSKRAGRGCRTDARIAAGALAAALEGREATVVTRDEDVRRLVSAAARLILSPALGAPVRLARVGVLKLDRARGVFAPYFDSREVAPGRRFFFPRGEASGREALAAFARALNGV